MELTVAGQRCHVAASAPVSTTAGASATTVVLIHGAANDSDVWQKVARGLASAGYAVLAPDLPVAGGPVYGRRLAQVIRGAAISLGAHAFAEQDGGRASASNRMWKIFGCGGFYLGPWVEDMDCFAVGGRHCAWYRSPAEAAELARHYLDRPEERARVAADGRAHALRHHTYRDRLELLLTGREYELVRPISDHGVVAELERPDAGHPLDRA